MNDNKCDVSINKSLLPIVSGAAAKIIGPCPKKPKMDNIQMIDKPYNTPQDLVIDMNAIVADLVNNLLPTKIEDSSNNKSNVNKQPQDLVLQIDDDSSGSDVIDEGEIHQHNKIFLGDKSMCSILLMSYIRGDGVMY